MSKLPNIANVPVSKFDPTTFGHAPPQVGKVCSDTGTGANPSHSRQAGEGSAEKTTEDEEGGRWPETWDGAVLRCRVHRERQRQAGRWGGVHRWQGTPRPLEERALRDKKGRVGGANPEPSESCPPQKK